MRRPNQRMSDQASTVATSIKRRSTSLYRLDTSITKQLWACSSQKHQGLLLLAFNPPKRPSTMGRLSWYAGVSSSHKLYRIAWTNSFQVSTALAGGVIVSAFNQRANFYSACVYLAQSNLCLMVSNGIFFWKAIN